jgi:NAD(P) transhydrogenase
VVGVEKHPTGATTHLASGKRVPGEAVLYSAGRQGAVDGLQLERAGLEADTRGRITVNRSFRTSVRHIYAAGDVIGFPSLAASSMEQGRLAALDAFGIKTIASAAPMPIGIYTIPEISYVGKTEEELTAAAIPYEIGVSRYKELARGQIVGDSHGMLKLLVSPDDGSLLGVHVFGTGATELVHIGQMLMTTGGTVDHLVDAVFNYPTLAESYKVAALDAMNRVQALRRLAS